MQGLLNEIETIEYEELRRVLVNRWNAGPRGMPEFMYILAEMLQNVVTDGAATRVNFLDTGLDITIATHRTDGKA
jgi:hypothetical protein